jgi:hypothetical protein
MEDSELWRGVVHNFAGKYLGELTVRGANALECQQRLSDWFERWFPQTDIQLTACRLVTRPPEVLLASRPRPLEREPLVQGPAQRSVPWQQRYL